MLFHYSATIRQYLNPYMQKKRHHSKYIREILMSLSTKVILCYLFIPRLRKSFTHVRNRNVEYAAFKHSKGNRQIVASDRYYFGNLQTNNNMYCKQTLLSESYCITLRFSFLFKLTYFFVCHCCQNCDCWIHLLSLF